MLNVVKAGILCDCKWVVFSTISSLTGRFLILSDIGHDFDTKRSARCRPPQMSISQGFSSAGRRAVSHTAVPAGHPLHSVKLPGMTVLSLSIVFWTTIENFLVLMWFLAFSFTARIKTDSRVYHAIVWIHDRGVFAGPMGIVIAFSVAALGLKTAVKNQGFMPGTPQVISWTYSYITIPHFSWKILNFTQNFCILCLWIITHYLDCPNHSTHRHLMFLEVHELSYLTWIVFGFCRRKFAKNAMGMECNLVMFARGVVFLPGRASFGILTLVHYVLDAV